LPPTLSRIHRLTVMTSSSEAQPNTEDQRKIMNIVSHLR
jgi:hypothetical protein